MIKVYYIVSYIISLMLFIESRGYATRFRASNAIGGEIFILVLPILIHLLYVTLSDVNKGGKHHAR